MLDQVINIGSAESGEQFIITLRIKDGKLVALTAKNREGADYKVTLQLRPASVASLPLIENICCCPDPELGMVCRSFDGPCPDCS